MNRRSFLALAASTALVSDIRDVASQAIDDIEIEGELPPLPEDLKEFANYPPAAYLDIAPVGSGKPNPAEVAEAYEILVASPFGNGHLAVFEYFMGLAGKQAVYRREWPVRANPMIYHFFTATGTKPEGDITPWCAASLNWALLRGRASNKDEIGISPGVFSRSGKPFNPEHIQKYTTQSAASGSFRCWKQTQNPKQGDILVLANKGTESLTQYCRGQGHVTVYLNHLSDSRVLTIGGNQSLPGSNGAITKAKYSVGGGSRFFGFVKPAA